MVTREELRQDMEEMIGPAASAFDDIPQDVLEQEWLLWKEWEMHEGKIPRKWRELIQLAVAAASGNDVGVAWRTETAKTHGATEEELKETLFCIKHESGWTAYNAGKQVDVAKFKAEAPEAVRKLKEHIESKERTAERAAM